MARKSKARRKRIFHLSLPESGATELGRESSTIEVSAPKHVLQHEPEIGGPLLPAGVNRVNTAAG